MPPKVEAPASQKIPTVTTVMGELRELGLNRATFDSLVAEEKVHFNVMRADKSLMKSS